MIEPQHWVIVNMLGWVCTLESWWVCKFKTAFGDLAKLMLANKLIKLLVKTAWLIYYIQMANGPAHCHANANAVTLIAGTLLRSYGPQISIGYSFECNAMLTGRSASLFFKPFSFVYRGKPCY